MARRLGLFTTALAVIFVAFYWQFARGDSSLYPVAALLLAATVLSWILSAFAAAVAEDARLMIVPSIAVLIATGAMLF